MTVVSLDEHRRRAEEARLSRDQDELEFIDEFARFVSYDVADGAWEAGFDLWDDPACVRDLLMLEQAARAVLYRASGRRHPLHDESEKAFVHESDEDALQKFVDRMREALDEEPGDGPEAA